MKHDIQIKKISIKWLCAAVFDWSIIALSIYIIHLNYWLLPLSIMVIGNRQHALSILGHDGSHWLVSRNKKINDILTNLLVFYPLGISIKNHRNFHFAHHRNTNNDKDPEIALKNICPKIKAPVTRGKIILQAIGDMMGLGLPQILAFLYTIRPRRVSEMKAVLFVLCITAILIYYQFYLVIIAWNISLITSFWFCFRLRVWTEHVGLKEGETLKFDPTLWQRALFLPHNTWLHSEHHDNPSVPYDKLPILRGGKTGCTLRQARYYQK